LAQDKGIKKDNEYIGFEGFDQVGIEGYIGVSRGGSSTSDVNLMITWSRNPQSRLRSDPGKPK
jgi:hypothetical protein